MNIREMTQIALLLAVGYILRLVVPGYGAGMKPDVFLGMLFVIIMLKRNLKVTLLVGAVGGIITALTTTFPGGQIPNIIDKLLTSIFVLMLTHILSVTIGKIFGGFSFKIGGTISKLGEIITSGIIGFVGTLFSGSVFLYSALNIVGLPLPFSVLFSTVVVPAAFVNTLTVIVLYPLVQFSQNAIVGFKSEQVS